MSALPHSRFSTDDLPEQDRLAAWREDISVIFDWEATQLKDARLFHATFDLYHFGHSVLAGLKSSSGRYIRSSRKASRDGMDSILLQLFLEGGVQFGVGQRTTYAQRGDIVVFDLAQPVDNINQKFHHITAVWPRPEIEAVVPNIARWHGLCLPRENASVALLRQLLISSYQLASQFLPEAGLRIEEAMLALAGAGMAGDGLPDTPEATPVLREVLSYQIKRHIRENLGAPDQSPEQIARHFGISRRNLYQLFQSMGGIARYQRHLRLQRCLADLQNPQLAQLQISEIAYRWGFRHPATFNRNFREAFGRSPSEARCQAKDDRLKINSAAPGIARASQLQSEHQKWFMSIGI